mmetsp:Transcript_172625/g.548158  ORF Transcript_172625/g.548158 Transcript_172625/m.548158 type:complete len:257 (+) Transcript_172625:214-984(+)
MQLLLDVGELRPQIRQAALHLLQLVRADLLVQLLLAGRELGLEPEHGAVQRLQLPCIGLVVQGLIDPIEFALQLHQRALHMLLLCSGDLVFQPRFDIRDLALQTADGSGKLLQLDLQLNGLARARTLATASFILHLILHPPELPHDAIDVVRIVHSQQPGTQACNLFCQQLHLLGVSLVLYDVLDLVKLDLHRRQVAVDLMHIPGVGFVLHGLLHLADTVLNARAHVLDLLQSPGACLGVQAMPQGLDLILDACDC